MYHPRSYAVRRAASTVNNVPDKLPRLVAESNPRQRMFADGAGEAVQRAVPHDLLLLLASRPRVMSVSEKFGRRPARVRSLTSKATPASVRFARVNGANYRSPETRRAKRVKDRCSAISPESRT